MMENEQKYCVVATKRNCRYNRIMVSGAMSEKKAHETSAFMQKNKLDRLCYRYFKVAKYPFKEIK